MLLFSGSYAIPNTHFYVEMELLFINGCHQLKYSRMHAITNAQKVMKEHGKAGWKILENIHEETKFI